MKTYEDITLNIKIPASINHILPVGIIDKASLHYKNLMTSLQYKYFVVGLSKL